MILAKTLYLILLTNYYLTPMEAATMTCLAVEESGLNTKAIHHNTNRTVDYGLYQINSVHIGTLVTSSRDLLNTHKNIKVAVRIYRRDGIQAWSTAKRCGGK